MLFTQFEFLFIFLPLTLLGLHLLIRSGFSGKPAIIWLGLASLIFYGYSDGYSHLYLIGGSILFNYAFGILIASHIGRARAIAFAMAVLANLAALAIYKYTDFGIGIWNTIAGSAIEPKNIVLPLGISFFTFTQLAYLADVYADNKCERSVSKYVLFVTYFPHLIAGPILHHREMMPQFSSPAAFKVSAERWSMGVTIFAIGLFKKSIIADGFATIANPVFDKAKTEAIATLDAWTGALAYSLQIYFDFSGYCDMAIGLSLLFGILLPFNFDSPYKAKSIVEFWRRWHITLSRFLRDYLYIALGGNRFGDVRRYTNLFITMLLGGLWHGANWTFVVWGALHGAYLVINHLWTLKAPKALRDSLAAIGVSLVLTQLAVVVAWVYFRAEKLSGANRVIECMLGLSEPKSPDPLTAPLDIGFVMLGYATCVMLPNVRDLFRARVVGLDTYKVNDTWSILKLEWTPSVKWACATSVVLCVAIFCSLIAGDGSQFLYFQF